VKVGHCQVFNEKKALSIDDAEGFFVLGIRKVLKF
jgi:hypothetical protein